VLYGNFFAEIIQVHSSSQIYRYCFLLYHISTVSARLKTVTNIQ
jgi:hypothetical protein